MAKNTRTADGILLRVAKIVTFYGEQPLTNATGFFFLENHYLYLITARHVVTDQETGHFPDTLQVFLHSDTMNLHEQSELRIPLFVDGIRQWWEHPTQREDVDLVAVSVNNPVALTKYLVTTFTPDEMACPDDRLPIGQEVFVVGFPLGFHDTLNHLPILRRATVASSYNHPFKGNSYFLTDARMHRGMSGAPVIVRTIGDQLGVQPEPSWKLLGIHTSALDVSDREPDKDEKLALNITWYATLISEILPVRNQAVQAANDTTHRVEAGS